MFKLRPYQEAAIASVYQHWRGGAKSVLMQMPTGAGKSATLGKIVEQGHAAGRRILVIAHRSELVEQLWSTLNRYGIQAGIIQAGVAPRSHPIQVCSIQTLINRLHWFDGDRTPNLLIFDEAHHCKANTYLRVLGAYPSAKVLGVTATPCRIDGKPLGDIFEHLVLGPSIEDLISAGFLVTPRYFVGRSVLGDRIPKVAAGDYQIKDLSAIVQETHLSGELVAEWQRLGQGRQTVVFAVGIEHSLELVAAYREAGVSAAHIDGTTPKEERANILSKFASGEITVLSNVGIVTEGFDVPAIGCVQLARPTKSVSLMFQMIGRGLRPQGPKQDCIILDHAGIYEEHGSVLLPRDWSLERTVRSIRQEESARKETKKSGLRVEKLVIENRELLVEVSGDRPPWLDTLEALIRQKAQHGYKPMWVAYRMRDRHPELIEEKDWRIVAKALGFKWQWARHFAGDLQNRKLA